jgi:hypothetical protein
METKYTCDTIKRRKDVHSIRFVGAMHVNKLLKNNLVCFCCLCVDLEFLACENLPWTKEWEVEVLIPNNARYVRHAMEDAFQKDKWDEYNVDGDHLAFCISMGDNFAINFEDKNEERMDFYVLVCMKDAFNFHKPFKCPWGQEFNVGDMAVASKYY